LLIFKFKSGQPENNGSLIAGWWGILGLIGWGYMVSAFTYLICRDSIPRTTVFAFFFLGINILSGLKLLEFLNPVKPLLGIIIEGNVPFIVLTGLIAGLMVKNRRKGTRWSSGISSGLCCLLQDFYPPGSFYQDSGNSSWGWFAAA
jgi:hypothetical protein